MSGRYYAESILTVGADQNLITTLRASLGFESTDLFTIKKLTMISSDLFTVDVNNLGSFSDVYVDTDLRYKLSLDYEDVIVSSLVVHEAAVTVFVAIVY